MMRLMLALCVIGFAGVLLGQTQEKLEAIYQRHELLNLQSAPASANREYRLMAPKHYLPEEKVSGKTWPLVIYMHGGGSKGEDGLKPLREDLPKLMATPEIRGKQQGQVNRSL